LKFIVEDQPLGTHSEANLVPNIYFPYVFADFVRVEININCLNFLANLNSQLSWAFIFWSFKEKTFELIVAATFGHIKSPNPALFRYVYSHQLNVIDIFRGFRLLWT